MTSQAHHRQVTCQISCRRGRRGLSTEAPALPKQSCSLTGVPAGSWHHSRRAQIQKAAPVLPRYYPGKIRRDPKPAKALKGLAHPSGFEPKTVAFGGLRSFWRGDGVRRPIRARSPDRCLVLQHRPRQPHQSGTDLTNQLICIELERRRPAIECVERLAGACSHWHSNGVYSAFKGTKTDAEALRADIVARRLDVLPGSRPCVLVGELDVIHGAIEIGFGEASEISPSHRGTAQRQPRANVEAAGTGDAPLQHSR